MGTVVRDEYTPVAVDVRVEGNLIVIRPTSQEDCAVMQRILDEGEKRLLWNFMGVRYNDSCMKDRIIGISYACGGTPSERREGNIHYRDYEGALKVYLDLSDVVDKEALWTMRCMGYYTGGMLLQPDSTCGEMRFASKKSCKRCAGPLKKPIELEWKVCDTCSQACEHDYHMGVGQASGRLAYLSFCSTCGRGDPNWEPDENPSNDLVRTVTDGPLDMLLLKHPDHSVTLITKK